MRVAVIGSGFMGRIHAAAFRKMPDVELVGIGSDTRSTQDIAEQLDTTAYDSFERMLSDAQPDVLSICLPTYLHKDYALKAAEAGIHIICEKPIATTLADAKAMIAASQKHQVRLLIGHVVRYFPNYVDAQRNIAANLIGKIGVAHTKRTVGHPGSWFNDPEKSGGVIMDLLIHDLDFVRNVLGEAATVYAMHRKTNDIEYALVTLKFTNGAIANIEGLWGHSPDLTYGFEFAGQKGIIRFQSENASSLKIVKAHPSAKLQPVSTAFESPLQPDPYEVQLRDFIDCIREDREPIISVTDAYHALELAIAANHSAKIGLPVQLQAASEQQGGMTG